MTQLWILRTDVHPLHAVRTGLDHAICGDCLHRGAVGRGRTCYVTVAHAPAAIFRSMRMGSYTDLTTASVQRVSHALKGQLLRIGAYGDPAAVPVDWWLAILRRVAGWTAYTHHWRICDPGMRRLAMASVDSLAEQREAVGLGYRAYRVRTQDSPLFEDETVCPASEEAGHTTTCHKCLLCNGAELGDGRKSISIQIHGSRPVAFYRTQQPALEFE